MPAPRRLSSSTTTNRFSNTFSVTIERAFGQREQHHGLRLQVGGEARERQRADVDRQQAADVARRDRQVAFCDDGAHGTKFGEEEVQVARLQAAHGDLTAGSEAGRQVGAGLYSVGDHPMSGATQRKAALDANGAGAGALYVGAHAREKAARSPISGSRAAFSITVMPSAAVAAMSKFSVAPTLG